jgi:4-diphosphocytidyl-2-C-methyl-D-erythritol kinase
MHSLRNVLAPAKLNLFLHITARRDDGYHLLQSAFMLIDWCDVLHFERLKTPTIERIDLTQPLPQDDLVVRAARLLQAHSHTPWGARIEIEKNIPAQAGMGGGSSDAAATLLALNQLWDLHWSVQKLAQLGLTLGADVPFFLYGHNAWVEGIGERITPLEIPKAQFVVIKPTAGLETTKIFQHPDLERATKSATMADFAAHPFDFGRNDLQPVAQALCLEIDQALSWLSSLGLKPRMTGSGSAVFARIPEGATLGRVPEGWQMRVCSNMTTHPLADWVVSES